MDKVYEGTSSTHHYVFTKSDGVTPVGSIESARYKVTDGYTDLVPWTDLPLVAEGDVVVSGIVNRLSTKNNRRYVGIFVIHDGGQHLPREIVYKIIDQRTITPETEPTT